MSATTAELLAECQDAIMFLLEGRTQEYRVGQMTYRRIDLPELIKLRTLLEGEVARSSGRNTILLASLSARP